MRKTVNIFEKPWGFERGLNDLFEGVPLHEVDRILDEIREYVELDLEIPAEWEYEVNEGDKLYEFPVRTTEQSRWLMDRICGRV